MALKGKLPAGRCLIIIGTEGPKDGRKSGSRRKQLQTFLLADSLLTRLDAVQDLARLSQQEMGLSTLFVAFGFLEWRQSKDSDKALFAPLLLLPVVLSQRSENGKKIYSVKGTSEAPEFNVTLAKYLEREKRILPEFDPDEDCVTPIEDYFSLVSQAIEGLPNWRVRRFLTIGHFAFGRLAMYQDIDPANWGERIQSHPLVGSMLRGAELSRYGDDVTLSQPPEDYAIDTPEVEKLAPLLVHDADASQHSAIVDVMKGDNLVIEGPPGTGKSQTITNIIANALSRDKPTSVLFLSEKLAALKVVKRRLDVAGLGDFCLELHSDESSPKSVVKSLKASCDRRIAAGPAAGAFATKSMNASAWAESRMELTSYLEALHAPADDGATAFELFWRSISTNARYGDELKDLLKAELPAVALDDMAERQSIEALLRLYGEAAQEFETYFGRLVDSPWFELDAKASPGRAEEIIELVRELTDANDRMVEVAGFAVRRGLNVPDLVKAEPGLSRLSSAPDLADIQSLLATHPDTIIALANRAGRLRDLDAQLKGHHLADRFKGVVIDSVLSLHDGLWDASLAQHSVTQIALAADDLVAFTAKIEDRARTAQRVAELLQLGRDTPYEAIPALCGAVATVGAMPVDLRSWLAWEPPGDRQDYREAQKRWQALIEADDAWKARLAGYAPDVRPSSGEVREHAKALSGWAASLLSLFGDGRKNALACAATLGISDKDAKQIAAEFEDLACHLESIEAFESDPGAEGAVGHLWNGMRTDFGRMDLVLKAKNLIVDRLSSLAHGNLVVEALFRLDSRVLDDIAEHKDDAARHRTLDEEEKKWAAGLSISDAAESATELKFRVRTALKHATNSGLSDMDAPLSAAMELAALIKERQVLNQEIQAVPRGNEIRDLIRDHHDVERVVAAARWVHEVRCASLPEKVVDLLLRTDGGDRQAELTPPSVRAAEAARDLAKAANTAAAEFGVAFDANDNLSLAEKLARLTERRKELPYQLSMAATRRELRNAGLGSFVAAIEKSSIPPSAFSDVFDRIVTNKRADRVRKANQRLRDATGLTLNGRRKAFAEQDRLKIGHDRKLAASAMLRRDLVPGRNAGPKKGWTEMALVNNEVKKLDGEDDKRRRFAPVRSLLAQAPGSIRALKPCFMMSPLSVSKFLPRYMEFDVVVIDEASQMRPEDALGALLRAKQIVVVGDPKQLPPTDFFNRAIDGADTDDEEQEDIEDESILEACSKAFDKVRRLKWHYRSRCESLIAFSNEQFYDRSLITFPMAKPESFSVDLVKVAGHYQASQNPAEAQRVCEEAIDLMCRLADAPDAEFGTIGVVAVNSQQREAIVEQFRLLSAGNEAVETFMSRAEQLGEPFFVKNLENVQGDERDYVMISLTYGRAPGKAVVNQTFGPINRSQGHRRLNVLFSRARRRVGLFSSMASTDIRPSETSKLGVHILKRYLEYAERGRSAPGAVTGKPFDSPFEEEVCRRLVDLGYKVDVQVGVSKFRIDLGIRHPLHPSIYLAGVECDGAAFHSSRSARDRDRLREEVLRGLGWSLVRIWSTDWFSNPDTATERLVKQLKDLEALPVHIESEIVFGTNAPDISPPLGAKVDAQAEAPVAPTAESPATEVPSVQPAPLASEDSEVSSLPDPPKIVAAPPVRPNVRAASTPPKTLLQQDLFNRTPPTQSDLFAESDTPKKRNESLPLEPSLSKKTGRLTSAEARQALVELRSEIAAKLPEAEAHRCILRDIMIDHFLKLEHCDEAQSMWFRLPTHLRSGTDPAQKREFLEIIFDIVDRRNA